MSEPNPYSPGATGTGVDVIARVRNSPRAITAAVMGLCCCLTGPAFLWLYWAGHGFDGGIIQTAAFFGLIYVAPGLIAVAIGLLAGFFLSTVCPHFDDSKRRAVVIVVAVVANAIGIGFLLAGSDEWCG